MDMKRVFQKHKQNIINEFIQKQNRIVPDISDGFHLGHLFIYLFHKNFEVIIAAQDLFLKYKELFNKLKRLVLLRIFKDLLRCAFFIYNSFIHIEDLNQYCPPP